MFDFLYQGLGYVMRFCYYTIGFESYALALLWFALIVKIILLPFSIKQQKNQIKGAMLRPKLYAIEKKYAGRTDRATMQKKQQEIMEMQQREGYSPLSGCLPMLIQLPLILMLYRIIQRPLTYICRLSEETVNAIKNLLPEAKNATSEIEILGLIKTTENAEVLSLIENVDIPNFNFFGGLDLSIAPTFWSWALLIPVFVFASQFFTMKLTRILNPPLAGQTQTRETEMSMKIMDFAMPAMTLFLALRLPAALGLYWIYQSVLAIGQMFLLAKTMPMPRFTEEELKAAERELRGKAPKRVIGTGNGQTAQASATYDEDRPRPRSLHYIDEEDDLPPLPKKPQQHHQPQPKSKGITAAPLKDDDKDNK